jgi:hypothetical protein
MIVVLKLSDITDWLPFWEVLSLLCVNALLLTESPPGFGGLPNVDYLCIFFVLSLSLCPDGNLFLVDSILACIVFLGMFIVTSNFLLSLLDIMTVSMTSNGCSLDFEDIVGDNNSNESILLIGCCCFFICIAPYGVTGPLAVFTAEFLLG